MGPFRSVDFGAFLSFLDTSRGPGKAVEQQPEEVVMKE